MVMRSSAHRSSLLAGALACLTVLGPEVAHSQPVLDLVLADAQVVTQKGCAILKVNFNIRIRYAHHFPLDRGDELRITVNPVDRDQLLALQLKKNREAVRAPDNKLAAIKAIDFETRPASGSVLRIQFDHPVAYRVAQSSDVQSIIVAISGPNASAACKPEFPAAAAGVRTPVAPAAAPARAPTAVANRPKERGAGRISDADLRSAAAAMDEARAALKKNNIEGAIQLLTKVLRYPENECSAEAQELLGLARQRSGQMEAAKAEYEDYLARYPTGEASDRVRQRLAGIVTASGGPGDKLRAPTAQSGDKRGKGRWTSGENGETVWTFTSSTSVFYIRDDSFRVRDPTLAPDPNADADAHRVHQNELLSSVDALATWSNDQTRGKIRFSGTQEHHFDGSDDRYGVAALFSEIEVKDWDVLARVGRQVRNTDGVLGRFDGGLVSWQTLPWAKFNVVAGSPVLSRFDMPFKDQKWFYGASVDFGPFLGGLETSLYAIEQRDRSLIDRQAVGTELRYFDQTKSMFATVDYDTHFQKLNAAIFSGSWTLPDKSTIYGGADYRRTPFLSTWNALLNNQSFTTLYDMLRLQEGLTKDGLQQLALDQTPIYKSAMIGYSRPLNENFQVSADATVVNLSQPVALSSIATGLPNLPAGNEYYYSTQLMASNLLKPADMYMIALRYSQLVNSNMYVLDFNSRYPLLTDFSVSPRLRLGYREGRGIDLKEYTALPSLLVDYYWTRSLSFEAEVGWQQTWSKQAGIKDNNGELFLTFGFRYDFYADDSTKNAEKRNCASPVAAALCRYSTGTDKSSCASPPPGCR
jgi:tetratricopeptide (TPR) repeat protein